MSAEVIAGFGPSNWSSPYSSLTLSKASSCDSKRYDAVSGLSSIVCSTRCFCSSVTAPVQAAFLSPSRHR